MNDSDSSATAENMVLHLERGVDDAHVRLRLGDASITLTPEVAGSLGGYLLAAAHAPLQTAITVSGAPPEPDRPAAEAPKVTPAAIAKRVGPPAPAKPMPVHITDSSGMLYSSGPGMDIAWGDPDKFRLTKRATEQLEEHGLTTEDVQDALANPVTVGRPAYGDRVEFRGLRARVIVPRTTPDVVIGVIPNDDLTPTPSRRSTSGGPGRTVPDSWSQLEELLKRHGFTIEPVRGGGHRAFSHPDHPEAGTIFTSATPSDHRSYENLIAQVRRMTGIDLSAS